MLCRCQLPRSKLPGAKAYAHACMQHGKRRMLASCLTAQRQRTPSGLCPQSSAGFCGAAQAPAPATAAEPTLASADDGQLRKNLLGLTSCQRHCRASLFPVPHVFTTASANVHARVKHPSRLATHPLGPAPLSLFLTAVASERETRRAGGSGWRPRATSPASPPLL